MPGTRRIAIVILNWNGRGFLEKFLPVVINFSKDLASIVIADNSSTDNSIEYLSALPDVSVIKLDKNYGFTGGYNRALKEVNADYYVLLNSDVQVTEGWLNPLLEYMDANPQTAACQPKIRSHSHPDLLEHAGAAGGYIDYLGYPFCRGRLYNTLETDHGQYDDVREVFWATGACMFIRSNAFHTMQGFDEMFFAHMEEIDLCWRLQQHNYKIAVIPKSTVYHVGGGTLPKSSPRKTYYNFRNNLMMLHKNLPASRLWWILPFRLILDGIAGLKFLADGDYGDVKAVIKAHFSFYASLGKRRLVRKHQQSIKLNDKVTGMYMCSIVKEYYLLRKKQFSALNPLRFTK